MYMDETGVVETNANVAGQDVRFHSSFSWAWWPNSETGVECIDGATGFLSENDDDDDDSQEKHSSLLCTQSLVALFLEAYHVAQGGEKPTMVTPIDSPRSLVNLRQLKTRLSPEHENFKEQILTKHRVLRQWRRRSEIITTST
jgi:hypothetical protein